MCIARSVGESRFEGARLQPLRSWASSSSVFQQTRNAPLCITRMSADFMETLPAYLEQPSAAKAAKTHGIYGSAEAGPFQNTAVAAPGLNLTCRSECRAPVFEGPARPVARIP